MKKIEIYQEQIKILEKQIEKIENKILKIRGNTTIRCCCCNKLHKVAQLDAIQTNWETPAQGYSDPYWNKGEIHFICPTTQIRNRILFDNNDVPWSERNEFRWNPEEQFRVMWRNLFKSTIEEYDKDRSYKFYNNYYVDKNRKKFGLVEKGSYDK